MDEVAALELFIAHPGLEHQRMVRRTLGADLTDIAEVLENIDDGPEDLPECLSTFVGGEHDRAAKDDVLAKKRDSRVEVFGFDGRAKRVCHLQQEASMRNDAVTALLGLSLNEPSAEPSIVNLPP